MFSTSLPFSQEKFAAIRNDTISGAFAGVMGTLLGHPLDIIKVRMQVAKASAEKVKKGILGNLIDIVRKEGFFALYKGVASPMLALTILNTLSFAIYCQLKRVSHFENYYLNCFIGGAVAGTSLSFISTPFELVKIQQQLDNVREQKFKSSFHCCRYLYQKYGSTIFYKGYSVNTIRETVYCAVYFTLYEFFKIQLNTNFEYLNQHQSISVMIAGGWAGMFSWLCSFPFDVVKSIIQDQLHVKNKMLDVARANFLERGARGFFSGIYPSMVRAFFVSGTRFSTFEFSQKMLPYVFDRFDNKAETSPFIE